MKRILVCSFVVLSFFGLMVLARSGGSGHAGRGGGRGGGHGGAMARSGGSAVRSSGTVGRSSGFAGRTSGSAVARSGAGHRGGYRHHHGGWGHHGGRFRSNWYGPVFWDTGLYPYFYDYCSANPWDERCYDDYYEPGISFGIGF